MSTDLNAFWMPFKAAPRQRMARVWLVNSGLQACQTALKIARVDPPCF